MPYEDTASIEGFIPAVATTSLSERMSGDHIILDGVDWFWRTFISDGDEGLYSTLVEPLTGDFNRIAANGETWNHVSTQFQNLSKNLTDNTHTLLSEHWARGQAAEAFQGYVEINWVGALFIAEQLSSFMAKGFEKLSEWSIRLAEAAVNLIEKIVQKIFSLAKRFVPGVGQAKAVWDWLTRGDFPYISDVEDIKAMIEEVMNLHTRLEELSAAMQGYMSAYRGVADAISAIPEINSTQDVVEITKTISGGRAEMEERKTEFEQKKGELEGQLGEMDRRLNPTETPG